MVLVSLFWSIFLPTSVIWSFRKSKNISIHPLALNGLYLQIALIYLTSFLVKNGEIWLDGNAIELVVQDEYYAAGLGFKLRNYPLILKLFNYIALIWEFLIPVFILWPFKRNLKIIAAVMITLFHLGLLLIAQVGPFWIIGLAFSAALLPQEFWEHCKFSKMNLPVQVFEPLIEKSTDYFKTVVLFFFIAIMVKGNLRYWYIESYVSPLMCSIPGSASATLFQKTWIPSYFLYGFKDQPWLFFQMTTVSDLGLFVIVEEDKTGVFSLNGIDIAQKNDGLDNISNLKFKNGFDNNLRLTDYLYMVSLKSNYDRFKDETYHKLLVDYSLKMDKDKESALENLHLVFLSKIPKWNGTAYTYDFISYPFYELNVTDFNKE